VLRPLKQAEEEEVDEKMLKKRKINHQFCLYFSHFVMQGVWQTDISFETQIAH
jgi:hypothetical protein